ncbi:SCAN domain-containing protein 3-like [Homarus americanus]|uniref:SCAN domain-containing protein 3-like n=1 Tax=Homarus americanus TaxID=6706 RepID=UPI001C4445EE|nr:SCAN domain-containing protein 3-like [Homarus americanus]
MSVCHRFTSGDQTECSQSGSRYHKENIFEMAVSVAKKRKYNAEYINYGFTSILADGIEKPRCVLCFKVLGNDSMRPTALGKVLARRDPLSEKRSIKLLTRATAADVLVQQEKHRSTDGGDELTVVEAEAVLDESTDVSSCAQLLVFVRYVFLRDIKDEYLFCAQLETTTTTLDVMEKLTSFFTANGITWENCCEVCTDGAPAMLGSKSGLQKQVKEGAPSAKGVQFIIYRFALASKTLLPDALCKILEAVVKCVNFVKTGDLNSRLFQTSVEAWIQSMKPSSFTLECDCFPRLQNWQRKVSAANVAMFENLSTVLDEIEEDHLLDPSLKNEIIQLLKSLESELKRYFLEFEEEEGKLMRNPFTGIPDDGQDEFLNFRNDSPARDLYEEKSPTVFWCSMYQSYQKFKNHTLFAEQFNFNKHPPTLILVVHQ